MVGLMHLLFASFELGLKAAVDSEDVEPKINDEPIKVHERVMESRARLF